MRSGIARIVRADVPVIALRVVVTAVGDRLEAAAPQPGAEITPAHRSHAHVARRRALDGAVPARPRDAGVRCARIEVVARVGRAGQTNADAAEVVVGAAIAIVARRAERLEGHVARARRRVADAHLALSRRGALLRDDADTAPAVARVIARARVLVVARRPVGCRGATRFVLRCLPHREDPTCPECETDADCPLLILGPPCRHCVEGHCVSDPADPRCQLFGGP